MLDFYVLSAAVFHDSLRPALSDSWRRRSFAPCAALCAELLLTKPAIPEDCLVRAVVAGLPFTRTAWQGLVGELVLFRCVDLPQLQLAPATLGCLLAPESQQVGTGPRSGFATIEQVLFGTRDLRFGGVFYRPERAGYNDVADVTRLRDWLAAVDPTRWTAAQLLPLTELATAAERAEELAFVRDWWPELVTLYREAAQSGCLVVCERG